MKQTKKYNVIGVMTGTSMDGIDLSFVRTDGKEYFKLINEKKYSYKVNLQNKLKQIIKNKPKSLQKSQQYFDKFQNEITNIYIFYIRKFIDNFNLKIKNIDMIGLSGQTMFHNPEKKLSIQLGSGKQISEYFKINVISDFRNNDIKNGGQGAPIGSFYHKYLLKKINPNAIIINLGGICNFSKIFKNKILSSDIGPANTLSDDISYYFFKKKYDYNGINAHKGKPNFDIIKKFKSDKIFKKKYPFSLDRNYFTFYYKLLKKINKNDALSTAIYFVLISILNLKKNNINFNEIILTGGGRKNKYLEKLLKKEFSITKVNNIDYYNFNGDLIESQMFAYLAVRSLKKLIISSPSSTGVKKSISGGKIYKFTG